MPARTSGTAMHGCQVDGGRCVAYVFRAMNLLLLLSALLSALSGIGGSARAPGVAQAVAGASVVAPRLVPAQARAAPRPVAALPTRRASAAIGVVPAIPRVVSVPAWADRQRE